MVKTEMLPGGLYAFLRMESCTNLLFLVTGALSGVNAIVGKRLKVKTIPEVVPEVVEKSPST